MEVPGTARKRHGRTRASRAATGCAALAVLGCVGACNLNNPGLDPPAGALSYPIGLALGGEANGRANVLYVVNSNFDLRYNAGSVHAYDLNKIELAIEKAIEGAGCESIGVPEGGLSELPDAGPLSPTDGATGPDASPVDASGADASPPDASVPDGAVPDAGEAGVASPDGGGLREDVDLPSGYEVASRYGTLRGILCDGRDPDPAKAEQCCFDGERGEPASDFLVGEVLIDSYASGIAIDPDHKRLYVPVRGRDRLVYIDTSEKGALSCGSQGGRCTRGSDASDKDLDPDAEYAAQPRALTVGKLSQLLPMSMPPNEDHTFIVTAHQNGQIALLVDPGEGGPVLHSSLEGFESLATTVALNKDERLLYTSSGAFGSANIHRYGIERDARDKRWLLYPSTSISLSLAGGYDIRDVIFGDEEPNLDDQEPTPIFALMRGVVQSVLFVERDSSLATEGRVVGATRVGEGSSKLTRAKIGARKLLFASCFDARSIFVIDEATRELVSVIRGLAGPFDMVVDTARERMYVADFRANVLRVVDIKGLTDSRLPPPRIIATLGKQRFGGMLK